MLARFYVEVWNQIRPWSWGRDVFERSASGLLREPVALAHDLNFAASRETSVEEWAEVL